MAEVWEATRKQVLEGPAPAEEGARERDWSLDPEPEARVWEELTATLERRVGRGWDPLPEGLEPEVVEAVKRQVGREE